MLKQIFSDAAMPVTVGEGVAPCPVQIADALAPSHVVILSALEGDHCSPPTPELKLWIASEGLDWRFGGTDVSTTQTDDAKTMAPSLEDLFDEKLQPTVLPLADFLQPVLEGGGMLGADPATCQTSQRSWFDHDATPPHKRTENCDTTVSNPSSLLAPLDAWWKQTLVDVIENESHGHLGTPILRSSSHLVSNIPECAFGPAPAPSSLVIGTKSGEAPVQNLVVKVKDYTAPAHRGQFDDISVCEYDELHYRSAYLSPFIAVVCSPQTSGRVTGVALSSLHKVLLYEFINGDSRHARAAMSLIVKGIGNCRFEDTRKESDEVVLVKVLNLMVLSLRCNASCLLRDRDIRKIIFICYQMGSRDGVSELVRNTADNTLGHMVLQMNGVWQRCSPVGKGTLELLMLFLTDLSNPRHKSDSTCILAMCLINIALERGNQSPRLRSALAITSQHDLCRHLLEASRTVNLAILSLISRVMLNLIKLLQSNIKMQLELFIISVHLRIIYDSSRTANYREVALENLLELCRDPKLMLGLYATYDCNTHCTNLVEKMFAAVSTAVIPTTNWRIDELNRLALECSFAILKSIVPQRTTLAGAAGEYATCYFPQGCRVQDPGLEWAAAAQLRTISTLQQLKHVKMCLARAAGRFNAKGDWLSEIQKDAQPHIVTAHVIAQFLHETPGLDKRCIGEFLSKGPGAQFPFNAAV